MSNHNPRRFLLTGLTALAVGGAALLGPGVASADGPRPQPHGVVFIGGGASTGAVINGIWVPQGSPARPLIGTTYGGDGHDVVEREQLETFVDAPGWRAAGRQVRSRRCSRFYA